MRIRVGDIPEGGLHVNRRVDAKRWDLSGCGLSLLAPLDVTLDLEKHSDVEIYVNGFFSARAAFECSRCLVSFSRPVEGAFHLIYHALPTTRAGREVFLQPDEPDFLVYSGDQINLEDEIRSQFLLALPMRPVCGDACRGLCPNCGVNLNQAGCRCVTRADDARWAPLKTLLHKETHAKSKT